MAAHTGEGTGLSGRELQRGYSQPVDLLADLLTVGATQSAIARILNVSPATVCLWTSGQRTPCRYNAQRLWRLWRDLTAWDTTTTKQGAA